MRAIRVGTVLAVLGFSVDAGAADIYDASDASFAGAVTLTFESDDIPLDATTLTVTSNGITFTFTSTGTSPEPIDAGNGGFPNRPDEILSYGNGTNGLSLVVNPPVTAIGFWSRAVDGCPGATMTGTTTEEVLLDSPGCSSTVPAFFGASGIGDIGSVNLKRQGSIWTFDRLVFAAPGVIPTEEADVRLTLTTNDGVVLDGVDVSYAVVIDNDGPDTAPNIYVTEFLPPNVYDSHGVVNATGTPTYDMDHETVHLVEEDVPDAGEFTLNVLGTTPAYPEFWCGQIYVDLAIASTDAIDPDLTNNVGWVTTAFDSGAQSANPEICGNGMDDNCDGAADCADRACYCPPMLINIGDGDDCGSDILGGQWDETLLPFLPDACSPEEEDASQHGCTVPRGTCGGVTVPAWCCDPATWSNPANNGNLGACDLGVPGCVPHDPNWLEATPHVSLWNQGYTAAGETIDYIVHYENTGTGDAHDVLIINVLGPEVDASTLVIGDGGDYDATTRTIVWGDAVVPPNTPREVGFSVDVNADATAGTRVRDVATIVFPDAVPPERTDTNFVEHLIPTPGFDPSLPDLVVVGCTETSEGSGEWTVDVVNRKVGFAFNVAASMVSPPGNLDVTDAEVVLFEHPDDVLAGPRTVIPNARTTSSDTVAFTATDDPCGDITWHITWEDFYGEESSVDVNASEEDDTGDDDDDETGSCGCGACSTSGPFSGLAGVVPLLAFLVSRRRRV